MANMTENYKMMGYFQYPFAGAQLQFSSLYGQKKYYLNSS